MTGQSLLDTMEVLFPELQLQSGEGDVTKGLIALNRAQDLFESHAAQFQDLFGGTVGTVSTTANQEYTTWPSGVLRLDGMQFIDPTSLLPSYDLDAISQTGGHMVGGFWPYNLLSNTTSGRPTGYWTNGTRIYWDTLPNATYTIRYYGFAQANDITAGGTFAYPDQVALPLGVVAVKIIRIGLDDQTGGYDSLAQDCFNPVLDLLSSYRRDGPIAYTYSRVHDV